MHLQPSNMATQELVRFSGNYRISHTKLTLKQLMLHRSIPEYWGYIIPKKPRKFHDGRGHLSRGFRLLHSDGSHGETLRTV